MASDGTGRVYKRGNVWWIDYSFRGKRYRESSKSQKKKVATKLLRKRMAEMGTGKLVGPTEESVTFERLRDLHLTDLSVNGKRTAGPKCAWKRLAEVFAEQRALDLTTERLRRYISTRQGDGYANSTIQKDLAAIKRAFNLARKDGILTTTPHVPSVKVSNTRKGFFDRGELEAVLEELDDDLAAVVRFAALTGWRKGEVLPLEWSQVDFEAGVVRLHPGTTKNDEGREFPFASLPPLRALLEAQRERTRALERKKGRIIPHVFHRKGTPIRSMRRAWKGACERAGLPDALFHDLRRTAVRNLERAGVPRSVAMKLTGHKTESVYRRYAIADAKALEEGVEKLARMHETDDQERTVVPMREKG